MNRPFLLVGIVALIASFIALTNGVFEIVLVLLTGAFLIALFTVISSKKIFKGVVIALIFVILGTRFISLISHIEKTNDILIGSTVEINGVITGITENEENFSRYTVKINDSATPAAEGITAIVTMFGHLYAEPGDLVSAKVDFKKISDRYKAYNFSNGWYFSCEAQSIRVKDNPTLTIWHIAYDIREGIRKAVNLGGSGEEGAVLIALLIGDTSKISDRFDNNVKAAGVSHMLVVSGMHLGIICGVLIKLIRRRTKRWVTAVVGILTAAFITVVCLFHVSILRASIAYFVMLTGRALNKDADGLSSLGFGAAVAVLLYPYIFHNVAFLLSITATFAVLYPAEMLTKAVSFNRLGKLKKPLKYIYEILAVSVCAMLCTLPIVAQYFGYVTLAAPIANLAVTFAVNAALVLGVLATLICFVPVLGKVICLPFYFLARQFISYFINAINFIGERGYGVVEISPDKNIYCFFISVAFILLVRVFYKYRISKKENAHFAERQNT